MVSQATLAARFSDGTFGYFGLSDATDDTGTAGLELPTIAPTGINITAGVSAGQAYVGKTMTHAVISISTQGSGAGAILWGALKSPNGNFIVPIQGGGAHFGDLPALVRPVRMVVGLTAWAAWQQSADGTTQDVAFVGYTSDGYCDVLYAQNNDGTAVGLVNSSGTTFGQSFSGKQLLCYYATTGLTLGLNDAGEGVSYLFVNSADGQLKGLVPAINTGGEASDSITPFVKIPISVRQNDTLEVQTDSA